MKRLFFLTTLLALAVGLYGQNKIKVACVGNSVTYGTRIADREHDSYPAQLQSMLGDAYDVRNFGRPSATLISKGELPYIQTEEYRQALDFKADRVIIHLGLNDTDPGCWPKFQDQFITDYHALIDTFRTVNPKAQIWICRMTPIFHPHKRFQSGTRDWHGQIQQKIEQIARTYNVGLIDFYEPLHHRIELFPDALHPNPEGAGILAQKVYGALTGDFGGLRLSPTFGEGMVLQREQPMAISGRANAGEQVTLQFHNKKYTAQTSAQGDWKIMLPAEQAGGPYPMKIATATQRLTLKEVWVGEVWLCAGQSNMVFPLRNAKTARQDLAKADEQPLLHLFQRKQIISPAHRPWSKEILEEVNHLNYLLPGTWKQCNAEDAASFSAVAYHFGKMLADSLQCPVGLIQCAAGGAPAECWIDRTTLEYDYPAVLYEWKKNDHIGKGARQLAVSNTQLSSNPLQRHFCEPCYLFESGILPLKDFTLRGVIWYQGEANSHNIEQHERIFPLLQKSWRKFFHNPELPFYTVQLSSLGTHPSWPLFRDSQRRLAQRLPNTWMTVSSDWGHPTNIHPNQKQPIGQRLAYAALHHTYQQRHIIPSGPEFVKAEYHKGKAFLTFRYGEGLQPAKGNEIIGFELAGANGIYHPAKARVTAEGLEVSSKEVKAPQAVRYGWQAFTKANLVNKNQLPCSTFRDEQYH